MKMMKLTEKKSLDSKPNSSNQKKQVKQTLNQNIVKPLMQIEDSVLIAKEPTDHLYLLCNCLNWVLLCNKSKATDTEISHRLIDMFDLYCTGSKDQLNIATFVLFVQKMINHGDGHIRKWIRIFKQSQHVYNPSQLSSSN